MLSRYRGPGGGGQFISDLAVLGFVLNGAAAVVVLAIVFSAWSDESETLAAWVQAIGSPLAIAAAFLVARYQANRQDASAAEQRVADAALAEANKKDAAARSKATRLQSEAATLCFAQGALTTVAAQVQGILEITGATAPIQVIEPHHAEHFSIIISTLTRFDSEKLTDARSQAMFATVSRIAEMVANAKRASVGMRMCDFRPRVRELIPSMLAAVDACEARIAQISNTLQEMGHEPVMPFTRFNACAWAAEWRRHAPEILRELEAFAP